MVKEDPNADSKTNKISQEDYKKLLAKVAAVITAVAAVIAAIIFAATYEDSGSSMSVVTILLRL